MLTKHICAEIDPEAELMEDAPVLEESDEELLDLQHSRCVPSWLLARMSICNCMNI